MEKSTKQFIYLNLLALFVGFMVVLGTSLILGPEKASRLPGGSISSGFMIGFTWYYLHETDSKWKLIIQPVSCLLSGLLGYIIFLILFT